MFLLSTGLAKPASQPIDGNAVSAHFAKRSLLLDVHGRGERALAVGERGHILLSTDGGKNWRQVAVPTRRTLTGVFLIDNQTAWSVGHQSVILKSGDGGETWAKANAESDPETAYLDVLFLDAKTGFIVGSYGKFLSTSDGGKMWTEEKQDDDPHFSHIIAAPNGGLWLTGEYGTVRRSDNRGASWQSCATSYEGTFFGALPFAKGGAVVFGKFTACQTEQRFGGAPHPPGAAPPPFFQAMTPPPAPTAAGRQMAKQVTEFDGLVFVAPVTHGMVLRTGIAEQPPQAADYARWRRGGEIWRIGTRGRVEGVWSLEGASPSRPPTSSKKKIKK